jgi:site-specific recombinase XerD
MHYVHREKLNEVLDNINPDQNRQKLRDYLILVILYHTGCRASEIINLKKHDIDYNRKVLKVIGKGRIERLVTVNSNIIQLIGTYLQNWKGRRRSRYLFTNNEGHKMYPMFLWRLIRKYFNPTEIKKNVSAHTIRHSIATHLYQNGASMKNVKDFLGHKHFKSTSGYVHFDEETLKIIYNRCHPKA